MSLSPSRTFALLRSERRFVNEVVTKLISAPSKFTAASLVSLSVRRPAALSYPILLAFLLAMSPAPARLLCTPIRTDGEGEAGHGAHVGRRQEFHNHFWAIGLK